MFDKVAYFDNSAATRMDERVLEAMTPYLFDLYAVATSQFGYSLGVDARDALEGARTRIAAALGAAPEEFVFTSGGTEASNLAIKGVARALGGKKGRHLVTSRIEDFPVLNSVKTLEKQGFEVSYVRVDGDGRVDIDHLRDLICPETILVTIQAANQEIGTLQDLAAIGEIAREGGVLFHTDATHAFRRIPLDVGEVTADLVTVEANTIHGPKGVGGLYVREGTPLRKWMDGGFQEFDLRPGAENIPGAVGFAAAVDLATAEEAARLQGMRERLTARLLEIPASRVNGHPSLRLPQNANVSFRFVEGESLLLHLDMRGYAVSTGSACFSRSLEASHVIMGIGGNHERAHGSVRLTLGRFNVDDEVNGVAEALAEVVGALRRISPLGKD
jgi:cysteine desulfurase